MMSLHSFTDLKFSSSTRAFRNWGTFPLQTVQNFTVTLTPTLPHPPVPTRLLLLFFLLNSIRFTMFWYFDINLLCRRWRRSAEIYAESTLSSIIGCVPFLLLSRVRTTPISPFRSHLLCFHYFRRFYPSISLMEWAYWSYFLTSHHRVISTSLCLLRALPLGNTDCALPFHLVFVPLIVSLSQSIQRAQ